MKEVGRLGGLHKMIKNYIEIFKSKKAELEGRVGVINQAGVLLFNVVQCWTSKEYEPHAPAGSIDQYARKEASQGNDGFIQSMCNLHFIAKLGYWVAVILICQKECKYADDV